MTAKKKSKKYKHEFTVVRSKWLHGGRDPQADKKPSNSMLLNERGSMCCVGFFLKSCGATNATLLDKGALSALYRDKRQLKSVLNALALVGPDSLDNVYKWDPLVSVYRVNDVIDGINGEREKHIKRFFADLGVKVTFVD